MPHSASFLFDFHSGSRLDVPFDECGYVSLITASAVININGGCVFFSTWHLSFGYSHAGLKGPLKGEGTVPKWFPTPWPPFGSHFPVSRARDGFLLCMRPIRRS